MITIHDYTYFEANQSMFWNLYDSTSEITEKDCAEKYESVEHMNICKCRTYESTYSSIW